MRYEFGYDDERSNNIIQWFTMTDSEYSIHQRKHNLDDDTTTKIK
jgi:hypothetical protein